MRATKKHRTVAYHEAGHAVMRLELGRRPIHATIKPSLATLGHVRHRRTQLDLDYFDARDWRLQRWAETEVMVSLAGREAERRLTGRKNNEGAASDIEWALEVARKCEGERARAFVSWLKLKTRDWIASPLVWMQIEAVAGALLERETLTGAEVREVAYAAVRSQVEGGA
jgi:ATP-dependent Zn protease